MTPPRVSKCKGIRNNYICVLALQHQLSTLLRISFYNKKKAFKVIWTKSDLLYLSLVIRLATRRQWHFKSKTREMYESTIQLSASMQRVLVWNWRTKNRNSNNNPHLLIWLKPVKILSLQMEWVLLVVPKDLKYDGLGSDVVHKWLGDLHCNLVRRKSSEAGVGDDEKAQACACSSPSALLSMLCMLGVSLHRPPTPHDRFPSGFVSNVTLPSDSILHPAQSSRTDSTLLLLMISRLACCSLYLRFPLLYLRKGPGSNSARKVFPPKPRWISREDKKNMCWLWTMSKAQRPVWDTLSSFVHLLFMLRLSENLPLSSEPFPLTQKSSLKSFYMETFPLNIKNIIFMSLYSMTIFPLNSKLLGDICGFMSQWLVKQLIGIYQRHTSFLVRDMYICLCLGLDYVHVEYMNKCPQRPKRSLDPLELESYVIMVWEPNSSLLQEQYTFNY